MPAATLSATGKKHEKVPSAIFEGVSTPNHMMQIGRKMILGVGPESKVALGTLSCFFPVALSVAAGMRQIDKVLIRVGNSFRANSWQMVTKIYLPAMRHPIINGIRLGLGVALIGTLLAETKLSNRGLGYLVIQAYSLFDMPRMYALLIVLFVLAIGANALIGRLGDAASTRRLEAP